VGTFTGDGRPAARGTEEFAMSETRADSTQRAVPMVSYEDVAAAIDWLSDAFGFEEVGPRFTDDQDRVLQAELDLAGARVMVGWPGPDYRGPNEHARTCDEARSWLDTPFVVDGVLVFVDDLDARLERARAAGARILRGPEPGPAGRLFTAADVEGHRWMFMGP
jgi:PhnB protein